MFYVITYTNSKQQKSVELIEESKAVNLAWHIALECENGFKVLDIMPYKNTTEAHTSFEVFTDIYKYKNHLVAEA